MRQQVYTEAQVLTDFRVFFEFNGNVHIISIEEVKKRNERTY